MSKVSLDKVKNPPKRFRPVPFWSWNEKLSVDETRRQIAEMDRAGIGGYFMHARGGLQTPYMGEEWMANIAAGVGEGRRRRMEAWAYDENGWPSGFGDGRVNGRGEKFQQKYLRYEVAETEKNRQDGRTICNVTLAGGRILHFYYDVNPFYIDTLDAKVIKAFLDEIYEPYFERFEDDFGGAMPGFFTDEPQVSRNGIPWSLTLPDEYRTAYGEELLPLLPQLFLPVGDYRRTRYRFWHLIQELFVNSFTKQIYDWCRAHGARLTGHMVLEESLLSQITSNGAVMPHYEFFHMPGMDWLGRHINPPTTPLQVASVAHQLGHKQILSETFALTGWNVSFEELKWIFEWQMVRGVTRLCQHLEGYSLRGIRKRDYPPSLFYQQPWWNRYRTFNDAVSRLGMLLSEGEVAFDVLVLHPQSSAWLHFDNRTNEGINELSKQFLALTTALESAHIPFHYGDERILSRHGKVNGARLNVALQSYQVVVVPPADTLARTTVELLTRFAGNGGILIWAGRQPSLIEGEESEELQQLLVRGKRVDPVQNVVAAIPRELRQISVTDAGGREIAPIAATWRRLGPETAGAPCRFYFFANAGTEDEYTASVRLPGAAVQRFVLEDGSLQNVQYRVKDTDVIVEHTFPPCGSLALIVTDDPTALTSASTVSNLSDRLRLEPGSFTGPWKLTLLDPNALTLDYCDLWFDGELQARQEHVSVIQERALKLERPVDIRMRFEIQVDPDYMPQGELYLVMEQPDLFRIELNGESFTPRDCGYYRDTSFRKLDISGRLTAGLNELVLSTTFKQSPEIYEQLRRARVFEAEKNKLTYDSEIEAVYLVGEFGVLTPGTFTPLPRKATRYRGEFVLGPLPERVQLDDLCPQGLPFFNGTVRLTSTITLEPGEVKGRLFQLKDKMATVASLKVNGKPVQEWYWRPYTADLDGFLKPGDNVFEIELTGNLRNLLGPHHLQEGESYSVAPGSFFKEKSIWGNQPWNDDYCFAEFGVRL